MSALDLDKRKVFSILEQKAKELEFPKKVQEIRISLLTDFYKDGIALLKNEESLDDIFLFIEEQTNRRFVCRGGYKREHISNSVEVDFSKEGIIDNHYDVENYDLIYTIIFDPRVKPIHPKTFIDRRDMFYITDDLDIFYFNGLPLDLGKNANYYKAFCIIYSLIPDGGEALFAELIKETKKRLRIYKNKSDSEIIKYLQDNLTGKKNGFQRKANLPDLDNGKKLLENIRTRGIQFNNAK